MILKVTVEVLECHCEQCPKVWRTLANRPPAVCPGCRSREWNGRKKYQGRPPNPPTSTITMPTPKRLRIED